MTNTQPVSESARGARAIALHITGSNFLLDGRFNHWMPVALLEENAESGVVQLLCDSTSPANDSQRDLQGEDLFAFDATKVRRTGAQGLKIEGTLRSSDGEHPVELVVQLPQGHSPFFFVSLPIDRVKFPALWAHFEERVILPIGEQEQMRPVAWLRPPTLAAA